MAFRRWRWYARILCGLALLPPLLWLLVVLVAPTGWARRQIVARLESRSGRRVSLEGVSVGLMGGIRLTNLQIGSPQGTTDPWLKAADIRLDFGLFQMLGGHCRPSRLEAGGVEVRVLRRGDGTIELADLIRPVPVPRTADGRTPTPEPRISVRLHEATVAVVDEPTRTRIVLQDVQGDGYAEGPLAVVEQLRGSVNGGEFRFAARIDRTASDLAAEAQLRADDVAVDDGMTILRYVVPVLAGASTAVKGRMNADVYVQGRGPTWPILYRDLNGNGNVALNRVSLDGTPLIAEISRFADLGPRRIGSIRTDFVYKARRVSTDHLTLNIGKMPITMSGWTDFDGRIDYRMKISGLNERLGDQARRLLGEMKLDIGSLTALTLRGTLDKMVVEINGVPIDGNLVREPRRRPNDRERIRDLGRQLRDQLLR
jgi:AsmA protein